jgi:predicted phosphodiesterase
MRITWVTDRNATGEVEFGPAEGELKRAFSSRDGLVAANERVHSVMLEGLQPGATYRYRVISREFVNFQAYKVELGETVSSEIREFRTLDRGKGEFSFLVLNDVHDQVSTIPEMLAVAGAAPYDFVVLNGDIVSHTDDEKPVLAVLSQTAASFASSTPMFWVRGNHETRGAFARHLSSYVGLPNGRYYYSFSHGPVHFVVLDAGEDKIDAHKEYSGLVDFTRYRREQAEWLKAAVRREEFQKAQYRVVICHMPFASRRAAEGMREREENVFLGMAETFALFGETLETAGVDLMFSGHTHSAALIAPEPPRHSYPIVQGGGNKGAGRTVIRVNVSARGMDAAILRPDGSLFASCHIEPRGR